MAHAATTEHSPEHETTTGLDHRKLAMWAFLGSECLFFGTFISTYLVYRNQSVVGPYPADVIDVPITSVSTFVLLMSSFMMVMALYSIRKGRRQGLPGLGSGHCAARVSVSCVPGFRVPGVLRSQTPLANDKPVRYYILCPHRFPRRSRDWRRHLAGVPLRPIDERYAEAEGLSEGGVGGALLALRGHRVDNHLHLDISARGERRTGRWSRPCTAVRWTGPVPDGLTLEMQNDALKTTGQPAHSSEEEGHPTVWSYIIVAIILAVITIIEVIAFFFDDYITRTLFIIVFLVLSGVKFAIVIMFYMHLKFDNILFSRLFIGGLTLAAAALFSLLGLFQILVE